MRRDHKMSFEFGWSQWLIRQKEEEEEENAYGQIHAHL